MKKDKIKTNKKSKIKKILRDKKAMFFTIGAFLLMLSLIAAMSIGNKAINIDKDLAIDRTYEISNSVEQCILDIFREYADLDVEIIKNPDGTTDVLFREPLKARGEWSSNFFSIVRKFEQFVKSEEPGLEINLAKIEDRQMPMLIKPHNISYTRQYVQAGGQDKIYLITTPSPGQEINFGSYEVTVDAADIGIRVPPGIQTKFNDGSSIPQPGLILFNITAVDNLKGNYYNAYSYVDPYHKQGHSAVIQLNNGNQIRTDLVAGVLTTYSNAPDKTVVVESKIDHLERTDEKVRITVYDSVINNSLPSFGVYRLDDVVIEAE